MQAGSFPTSDGVVRINRRKNKVVLGREIIIALGCCCVSLYLACRSNSQRPTVGTSGHCVLVGHWDTGNWVE